MSDFSLIKAIETVHEWEESHPKSKKIDYGIKYQQYDVVVDGEETTINIPLRETENFEDFLGKVETSEFSRGSIKKVLRHFRGTRG